MICPMSISHLIVLYLKFNKNKHIKVKIINVFIIVITFRGYLEQCYSLFPFEVKIGFKSTFQIHLIPTISIHF